MAPDTASLSPVFCRFAEQQCMHAVELIQSVCGESMPDLISQARLPQPLQAQWLNRGMLGAIARTVGGHGALSI